MNEHLASSLGRGGLKVGRLFNVGKGTNFSVSVQIGS